MRLKQNVPVQSRVLRNAWPTVNTQEISLSLLLNFLKGFILLEQDEPTVTRGPFQHVAWKRHLPLEPDTCPENDPSPHRLVYSWTPAFVPLVSQAVCSSALEGCFSRRAGRFHFGSPLFAMSIQDFVFVPFAVSLPLEQFWDL